MALILSHPALEFLSDLIMLEISSDVSGLRKIEDRFGASIYEVGEVDEVGELLGIWAAKFGPMLM